MDPAVLKGTLAVHGGMPVRTQPMPEWPIFAQDEIAAVADVMRSGKVNYCTGEQGRLFEREFADACGTKHAVAVANGTVALELALRSVGIRPGDHVVTSSRSFPVSEDMPDISASVMGRPRDRWSETHTPAAQDLGSALPCRRCRISSSSEGVAGIFRLFSSLRI